MHSALIPAAHRRARLFVATLALAVLATLVTPAAPADATTEAERKAQKLFVQLINNRREKAGLAQLRVDRDIVSYARAHCLRMEFVGVLFHDIDGYAAAVPGYAYYWENVGQHDRIQGAPWGRTVRALHRAFMRSPGHRENIMQRRARWVGVGVQIVDGTMWVTQNFADPV